MNSFLYNPQQAAQVMRDMWPHIKAELMAGHILEIAVKRIKRTNEQNKKMWAVLADIAAQVNWYGQKLTADDWKHILSASLKKQRAVQGIDGGFVVLGLSTSKMTKAEMSELLELAIAFGAQKNVIFNDGV